MNQLFPAILAVSLFCLATACTPANETGKSAKKSMPDDLSASGLPLTEPQFIIPVEARTGDVISVPVLPSDVQAGKVATHITEFDGTGPGAILDAYVYVTEKAKALAALDYVPPPEPPAFLSRLTYDDYRMIDYRPDASLFAADPSQFQLMLDARGSLFRTEIRMNIIDGPDMFPVPYDASTFDFEPLTLSEAEKDAVGLAGFRLLSPLNEAGKLDEVMSVKGASFFRALGVGNSYGVSARGIAVQTASPDGEEFPEFREFWVRKPGIGEENFRFYALLDGPSITGAYEFTVHVGAETVVNVRATLFARKDTSRLGIAPLTSMFEFGPQDPAERHTDFRPAVHDSEGLSAMLSNGEWIWRPLTNPGTLQLSAFAREVPRGFGLMQRTRSFESYQDIEAVYESRPSVWVTPGDGWRPGQLTLVEIPTPNEYNDNIISFWQLNDPLLKGERLDLTYQLSWGMDAPIKPNLASVHATRTGIAESSRNRLMVIDYDVADAHRMEGVEGRVWTSAGKVMNINVRVDKLRNRVRLSFELDPQGSTSVEMRAMLTRVERPVSETWLYRWSSM